MSAIEILAVIGVIGYVVFRQVQGEPLRGKRAVVLPVVLTVIGFLNLHGSGTGHLTGTDVACLVAGTAGSAAIGLAFGAVMRLESRGGYLWAQLPVRGLWLWAALAGWRVLVTVLASGLHAHVAASAATLLLSLGVNRLAQAAVVVVRATGMGVPFAPEKDGRVFLGDTLWRGPGGQDSPGARFGGGDDGQRGLDGRQETRGSRGGSESQDEPGVPGYGARGRRRDARGQRRGRR
jgi:hypothetical protein